MVRSVWAGSGCDGSACDGSVGGGVPGDGAWGPPAVDAGGLGAWLLAQRRVLDVGEAGWLEALARFDAEGGWADDGCLSVLAWLVARAGMARSTAYEKLQLARELVRRPVLAEALRAGRVSYSAARLIARAAGAVGATDEALVALAEVGSVADVARAVGYYLACAAQDRPVSERASARGVWMVPGGDGSTRVVAVLDDLEAAELDARLRQLVASRTGDAGPAGHPGTGEGIGAVGATHVPAGLGCMPDSAAAESDISDESDQGTGAGGTGAGGGVVRSVGEPDTDRHYPLLLADALMELVGSAGNVGVGGADRYMVHVVVRDGRAGLLGGSLLTPRTAAQVVCDCSTVRHDTDASGGPLRLGRRQRSWSVTQRRAILVRDDGHCRFPGCTHRIVDVHHLRAWEHGGPTDVDNGILVCRRHHGLLHSGWTTTGTPAGTLVFHRPGHAQQTTAA